jgi:hypothetical protein
MKKDIYYFDKRLNDELVRAHEFLLPALNDLLKAYNSLELVKLTTKKLHLLIKNPQKITDEIYQELRIELKNEGLPKIVYESTKRLVSEKITKIADAVSEIDRLWRITMDTRLNQAVRIEWEYYSVLNNKIILPSVSRDKIKEECSYFIKNNGQRKAISCINAINQKFQELADILEKNKIKIPVQVADNEHFGALRRNEKGLFIIPEILMKIKD